MSRKSKLEMRVEARVAKLGLEIERVELAIRDFGQVVKCHREEMEMLNTMLVEEEEE